MPTQFPRRPRQLLQPPNGCLSCVVAQILYVFGVTDTPDLQAVDRAIGRKPGEIASESKAQLFLLRQGFFCQEYRINDDDAFLEGGVTYLRDSFGRQWTAQHAAFYTPEKVKELQNRLRQSRVELRPYARQIHYVDRWATKRDIVEMLNRGRAVDIPLRTQGHGPTQHAGLLVPRPSDNSSIVWMYGPMQAAPGSNVVTVVDTRLRDVVREITPKREVVAYWR